MEVKEIKIDDIFFKNNFDCSSFENDIYNQFAKTMARSVDIDLAKTPLVDILTGYTRYYETKQELDKYKNIIDELILTGLASSITKEDFEYMWKVAYNKEYNPNDIKEIAERHGILKGE